MKRQLISLFITQCFITGLLNAQPRHVNGLDMFGLSAGIGSGTQSLGASYLTYFSADFSGKINGNVERVKFDLSTYRAYLLNPELLYCFYTNKRNIYLNAKAGFLIGMETLKSDIFTQNINNVYTGESLGLCLEYFLTDHVKMDLEMEQRFLQHSKIANYQYLFKLGMYLKI